MATGYKEAFGLADNPFGPTKAVLGMPLPLTANLQSRPLLLHRNANLNQLYCESLSSFQDACKELEAVIEVDGYTANPPDRGGTSYMVSIAGDRGAGKTTLACRMIQMMLERTPQGAAAWQVEELFLNSTQQTLSEQLDKLKALESKVIADQREYVCILVDDLLAEAYSGIATLYDNLLSQTVFFLVFTSWDPKMPEQIDKALHFVHRFSIPPLSPDDAVAFVTARYQRFRLPATNGVAAMPLFPFDEQDIRTAVAVRVISGASATGPVSLRMFATVLQAALLKRLKEIAAGNDPAFDLAAIPVAQLQALQIKVAQAYEIVVRK